MRYHSTRLETEEEVQIALQRYRRAIPGFPVVRTSPPAFRPTSRPPMAVVTVFDDGSECGEAIRIREDQFVLGRTEGNVVVSHDAQISGRHAELRRKQSKNGFRWFLRDLASTNGTFIRVAYASLVHGQEFMIGRTRFRFENYSPNEKLGGQCSVNVRQTTNAWGLGGDRSSVPTIVELVRGRTGSRIVIEGREAWLGTDKSRCQVVLQDDPFVSTRHARCRVDEKGNWLIENAKSLNGVWLRIERVGLRRACRFMLGEQVFMVRILSE